MNEKMIQVTQGDMEKLMALLASRLKSPTRDQEHLEMLAQELDRAEIVRSRDIPADTVTMHSHVLVRDLDTGGESTYTLVFPSDADIAKGKISILAPIATALLGYREGDEIEWPTPGGRRRLNVHPSELAMVEDLYDDHEILLRSLRGSLAGNASLRGDIGTTELLTRAIQEHEKMASMLQSVLGKHDQLKEWLKAQDAIQREIETEVLDPAGSAT